MGEFRSLASRVWPFAAAAAISLALFWGIAVFARHMTVWLFWAESVSPRHRGGSRLPLATFFGVCFPVMMAVAVRQRKNFARRKSARRGA
jgi:hypothetical protein